MRTRGSWIGARRCEVILDRSLTVYNRSVSPPRVLLLVLLCGLTFFVGLGRPAITDSDEAFYAEAAREMVEGGDWVTPHYNGRYRFEKPVLHYWLAALGYLIAGVSELAARFPSAMAGLVLVLTTYACARRWYDESTGMLAGAITATSFGYVAVARQALPDLLLACFITLGTWAAPCRSGGSQTGRTRPASPVVALCRRRGARGRVPDERTYWRGVARDRGRAARALAMLVEARLRTGRPPDGRETAGARCRRGGPGVSAPGGPLVRRDDRHARSPVS